MSSTVHFLHIGKAGGTALKHALRPLSHPRVVALHPHTTTLRDIPSGEKVFFVRTPAERFISGFLSRQRQGMPRYCVPWTAGERIAFERFHAPSQLAEALGSPDRARREAAHAAMDEIAQLRRPLSFWLESEAYLRSRLDDVLLIGLHERFADDFARLKKILNVPDACRLPDGDLDAHRAGVRAPRNLTRLATAHLLGWYADDFKLFEACRAIALARHPSV